MGILEILLISIGLSFDVLSYISVSEQDFQESTEKTYSYPVCFLEGHNSLH